jgi:hypothetical protein
MSTESPFPEEPTDERFAPVQSDLSSTKSSREKLPFPEPGQSRTRGQQRTWTDGTSTLSVLVNEGQSPDLTSPVYLNKLSNLWQKFLDPGAHFFKAFVLPLLTVLCLPFVTLCVIIFQLFVKPVFQFLVFPVVDRLSTLFPLQLEKCHSLTYPGVRYYYQHFAKPTFWLYLVRSRHNARVRKKILVTLPRVIRDLGLLSFFVPYFLLRHSSSYYAIGFVIATNGYYYYWVRFQQKKYSRSFYSELMRTYDLFYNVRTLSKAVPLLTYGPMFFFAFIFNSGLYLFYAGKSVLAVYGRPWQGLLPIQIYPSLAFFNRFLGVDPFQREAFAKGLAQATDFEFLKILGNFPFENFSLLHFFFIAIRLALRARAPLLPGL